MAEGIPEHILAPFVVGKEGNDYVANVPKVIFEHLSNPDFTEEVNPNKFPAHTKLHLIPYKAISKDEDLTIEKKVENEFGPKTNWDQRVKQVLANKGLIQTGKDRIEEQNTYGGPRYTDDKFTVKIDGLPEPYDRNQVMDLLRDLGCDYFDRVNVPREKDSDKPKPVAFVKFNHLRHAIKFIEDNTSIRIGIVLLSPQLVP